MSAAPTPEEVERFRATITAKLGLNIPDERLAEVAAALRARMDAVGEGGVDAYLARLRASGSGRAEVRALAGRLTVGETFFLRSSMQFDALASAVIPGLQRAAGGRRIRILSAGCASGEEAYSIAIVTRERFPDLAPLVKILGIDVNAIAIEKARKAHYSTWSLRDTPPATRARWFAADGTNLVLDESVRRMVTFEERNLAEHDPVFWSPGAFDVVFCRNVIMYFSESAARALVTRIARSLSPGGHLFLGHAETLRGLSDEFELRHEQGAFYYRRREPPMPGPPPPRSEGAAPPTDAQPLSASAPWMDLIQHASDHIERLARRPARRPESALRVSPELPAEHHGFDEVMDLVRRERFDEALVSLRSLPAAVLTESGTQLLLAITLTNAGDVDEAEEACQRLLALEPSNAGAHYLMALCSERGGDLETAARHDQTAAALDASFAMPHLHLALVARRARNLPIARAELDRALALLAHEEESRIALFGGGFQREALVELCRSELRAIEAADG